MKIRHNCITNTPIASRSKTQDVLYSYMIIKTLKFHKSIRTNRTTTQLKSFFKKVTTIKVLNYTTNKLLNQIK